MSIDARATRRELMDFEVLENVLRQHAEGVVYR
jgi:hypothetical protein